MAKTKTKLKPDAQEKIVNFVLARLESFKANRTEANLETKMEQNWKIFNSWVNEDEYPLVSKLFHPQSFKLAKKKIAKLVEYMFSTGRFVKVSADPSTEANPRNARMMEHRLNAAYRAMNIENIATQMLTWSVPVGTAWGKVVWKKDTRKIRTEDGTREDTVYDAPAIIPISPWHIYMNPKASEIEDSGGLIHAYALNSIELRAMERDHGWFNTGEAGVSEAADNPDNEMNEAMDQSSLTKEGDFQDHVMLHYWGTLPEKLAGLLNGEEGDEFEIVISEGSKKLHYAEFNSEPHGYRPFFKFTVNKKSGVYGDGILEDIKSWQFELNDTVNQANDLHNQLANPPVVYERSENAAMRNFVYGPNARLAVDDPDAIKPLYPQNIPSDYKWKLEYVKNEMEEASGIHRYDQGIAPNHQETATGILALQQASMVMHLLDVRLIETDDGLDRASVMIGALLQSEMAGQYRVEFKGDDAGSLQENMDGEYLIIQPQDIMGKFVYYPRGSVKQAALDKKRLNMPRLWDMFAGHPKVNQERLISEIFEAAGVNEPEEFLNSAADDRQRAVAEGIKLILTGQMDQVPEDADDEAELPIHRTQATMLEAAGRMGELALLQEHVGIHTYRLTGEKPEGMNAEGGMEQSPMADTPEGIRQQKGELLENAN